jgi:diguanylate cyclase (GGDEF)-like protein
MSKDDKAKILCVDDEPDILEALERSLRSRFQVLTATSPQQALTLLENTSDISVVISDHLLGSETGVGFLNRVKSLAPLASRVLLSGQIDLRAIEEAINSAKIHKFILKPWENDSLLIQVVEAHKIHKRLVEQQRLQHLSITDPVTQLTNHRFFQEKVRLEWEKHKETGLPLSLIMIDVDHFKKFNDRFGHPEGDKFLQRIASTLQEQIPGKGSLSRYGGEEFAVILPKTNSPEALSLAEKLRNQVLDLNYQNYPLSISLGVASAPEHASSVDELIISADQSLYQAKPRGRNQTVVGLNFGQ